MKTRWDLTKSSRVLFKSSKNLVESSGTLHALIGFFAEVGKSCQIYEQPNRVELFLGGGGPPLNSPKFSFEGVNTVTVARSSMDWVDSGQVGQVNGHL